MFISTKNQGRSLDYYNIKNESSVRFNTQNKSKQKKNVKNKTENELVTIKLL
jgi:hypothetical protein